MTRILQKDIIPTAIRRRVEARYEDEAKAVLSPSSVHGGTHKDLVKAIRDVQKLGGGTVSILAGTYKLEKNISIPSNVSLVGEDMERTIIDFNNNEYQILIQGSSGSELDNISISNLTMKDFKGDDPTFPKQIIDADYANNIKIESVKFEGCKVKSYSYLIHIVNCNRLRVEKCRFDSKCVGSVQATSCQAVEFSLNEFNECEEISLGVSSTPPSNDDVLVFSNRFLNTYSGSSGSGLIDISTSGGVVIGNRVIGVSSACYGVRVGPPYTGNAEGISIVGNYLDMSNTGAYGIHLAYSTKLCQVVGNYVTGAVTAGINLGYYGSDGASECTIGGNTITDSGNGITISDSSCSKNNVYGNLSRDGLTDSGTDTQTDGANITT